jgi:site-specific DNA recombinase
MNTQSPHRYILYARKSTDDVARQVRSIDDQVAELSELARRENLQVIDVLIEKQTAKVPGPPIFNAVLDRIEKGEADGILAWHPDRLARNTIDAGRLIYLVDTSTIKSLKFPTFLFEPTSSGKFMLSIMLGYSKYYVDNLSENIKRGQRQKLKNGIWPKFAPIGYLNDKLTRTIIVDPVRAPFVRKAFELYATGDYTFARVREMVNGLGLVGLASRKRKANPVLGDSNYQYILKNPIYYGVIRYHGEFYEAKHEPLISKALFDKAQEVMRRKSKPKTKRLKPYLYRGTFAAGRAAVSLRSKPKKATTTCGARRSSALAQSLSFEKSRSTSK